MQRIPLVIAVTMSMAACKDQPKKVEIRSVRVASIQHTPSGDTVSLVGQIQAKDQANLSFRIGGHLRERNVTVGDPVAPGQIVARIESQDYLKGILENALASTGGARQRLRNARRPALFQPNSEGAACVAHRQC